MEKSIAFLGRQPALGIAELESVYGAEQVRTFGQQACLLAMPAETIDFKRLGGSVRIAKVLGELPNGWNAIEAYLLATTPERASAIEGKLIFGISTYGLKVAPRQLAKTALRIKKAIRSRGASVRMVPHEATELNAATVLYNKLTAKNGWELVIVSDGTTTLLAQTVHIQDIDAYAERDQARPKRDAKVGMLPPKLAQIIINLAAARTAVPRPPSESEADAPLVLDPFCGTGVVLQEASLMGFDVYGTDINPRMVQYSADNLLWLREKYPDKSSYLRIEIGDATSFTWQPVPTIVAGESYLGQPLSALPSNEHLSKIIYEANLINHRFLLNLAKQIPAATRLCIAVPAWRGKKEFLHLPLLDHLTDMGYTRVRFKHVSDNDLIYHRENQVVARELLVLIKN